MSKLVEIRWTPELEGALVQWLLWRGQLSTQCPEEPTPDMLVRAVRNRTAEAEQAVQELRTVLETGRSATFDLDIAHKVASLRETMARAGRVTA
jgi:hypothetical protein